MTFVFLYRGIEDDQLRMIASRPDENLYISSFSAQDLADAVTNTAKVICDNSPTPGLVNPPPVNPPPVNPPPVNPPPVNPPPVNPPPVNPPPTPTPTPTSQPLTGQYQSDIKTQWTC